MISAMCYLLGLAALDNLRRARLERLSVGISERRWAMMLLFAVVVCVVIWSRPAEAIKWDFNDGTTQGWTAKEIFTLGGTREFSQFPGVVEDGVWRISVSPSVIGNLSSSGGWSSVEVVSSTIGYDSGLFDQVRIRFRTVHDRPSEGSFWITWENYLGYWDNYSG